MPDVENVIKGLKYLHDVKRWSPDESEESITARRNITGDALVLLKAQEPVIRCRDCKHWWEANELRTHQRHVHGTICTHECKAMDYCSDGERRDDDV